MFVPHAAAYEAVSANICTPVLDFCMRLGGRHGCHASPG
jgi:hypothetical protein